MAIVIQQQGVGERYRDFDMYAPSCSHEGWTAWHKDADDDDDVRSCHAATRAALMEEIDEWHADNSWEREEVYRLHDALRSITDLFALPGESSIDRFERLAAMFRKDTGYLAPGKDQPMCGPDQPDGTELNAIYDAWYQAKIEKAREALAAPRERSNHAGRDL